MRRVGPLIRYVLGSDSFRILAIILAVVVVVVAAVRYLLTTIGRWD